MTALAERTVEVTPLGLRGRYSMTPALQRVYLAAVAIADRGERVSIYSLAKQMDSSSGGQIADILMHLEERQWVTLTREPGGRKAFDVQLIEPVLRDLIPAA